VLTKPFSRGANFALVAIAVIAYLSADALYYQEVHSGDLSLGLLLLLYWTLPPKHVGWYWTFCGLWFFLWAAAQAIDLAHLYDLPLWFLIAAGAIMLVNACLVAQVKGGTVTGPLPSPVAEEP
jgi:hypothetical protein